MVRGVQKHRSLPHPHVQSPFQVPVYVYPGFLSTEEGGVFFHGQPDSVFTPFLRLG